MSAPGETRRSPSRKLILALVVFLGAPTALLVRQAWVSRIRADVTGVSPPGWIGTSGPAEFMVFRDRAEMLIRRGVSAPAAYDGSPVAAEEVRYFAYDPGSRSAAPVTAESWETSIGTVTRCGQGGMATIGGLSPTVEGKSLVLRDGDRVARMQGDLVIGLLPDFTGRRLLILSARDERWFKGGWPGLTSGPYTWSKYQHFHQVIDLMHFETLGASLRLPMVSNLRIEQAQPSKDLFDCVGWSGDSRSIIYVGRTSFIPIPVER